MLSSTDEFILMKEGSEMPRRGKIAKREVLQDPVYGSELVTRLVNNVMLDGKKGVAQKSFTVLLRSWSRRAERALWKPSTKP